MNENKQRQGDYSSGKRSIYIQPVEGAFWQIRLCELVKDITTRCNCYDAKALFKRGIDYSQPEKYLYDNTTPISNGVGNAKIVDMVMIDKRAINITAKLCK